MEASISISDRSTRRSISTPFAITLIVALSLIASGCAQSASRPASQPAGAPGFAPPKLKITIGKDTTFVDGPANPDGTIDYLAAFNARLAQGVTPQNNAVVALLKAMGPAMIPKEVRARTFKEIGMESLPEKGPYFEGLYHLGDDANIEALRDQATKRVWQAKDFPEIAAWLHTNEKPLDAVVQATQFDQFYIPWLPADANDSILSALTPGLAGLRGAARALASRAMLRSGEGDAQGARADLLAIHRLARLVSRQEILVSHMVAWSMEYYACAAEDAISAGKVSAGDARSLLADLAPLPPLPRVSITFERSERFLTLELLMMLARESLKGQWHVVVRLDSFVPRINDVEPWWPGIPKKEIGEEASAPDCLDWDAVLRAINHRYGRLVDADAKPDFKGRTEAFDAMSAEDGNLNDNVERRFREGGESHVTYLIFGDSNTRLARSKEIGELLLVLSFPGVSRASNLRDRAVMRLELSKVALALAAYRAEKGQFPDALAALAPAYMKEVPKDLFTDGPLVYKKTQKGYLLYSLGPNMKDDGGKAMEESPESFDIVVKVE